MASSTGVRIISLPKVISTPPVFANKSEAPVAINAYTASAVAISVSQVCVCFCFNSQRFVSSIAFVSFVIRCIASIAATSVGIL